MNSRSIWHKGMKNRENYFDIVKVTDKWKVLESRVIEIK